MDNNYIIKQELAAAYRILHRYGMADLTYTHLSARSLQGNSFFIYPLGLFFSEVNADNLLEVSLDGEILAGYEAQCNITGQLIHSSIYKARADINSIFHLHTIACTAVSAMQCGLLPLSQFSLHFFENIAYHHYNSLVLDAGVQCQELVADLKHHMTMLMCNHGSITCGKTIHEAMFYTMMLENACKVQIACKDHQTISVSPQVARKARNDMRAFEEDLGKRDFLALIRELKS
jgi:ribulose-5-phosphate 4-epimerase/fuculose-1-phosphate aldolase